MFGSIVRKVQGKLAAGKLRPVERALDAQEQAALDELAAGRGTMEVWLKGAAAAFGSAAVNAVVGVLAAGTVDFSAQALQTLAVQAIAAGLSGLALYLKSSPAQAKAAQK